MKKYKKQIKEMYDIIDSYDDSFVDSYEDEEFDNDVQEVACDCGCSCCGYSDEDEYDEYYVDDDGNVYDLQDEDYIEYEPEKTDDFYYENKNIKKFLKLKKIKEKTKLKEEVENEDVAEILKVLRDESFGNDEQRKKLISLLTSLFAIKDKSSRLIFKKLGMALTNIGDEMLDDNEVNEYYPSVEENEMGMENEYEPDMEGMDMMDDYDMYENNKIKKYKFKSVFDESTENYRKKLNEIK